MAQSIIKAGMLPINEGGSGDNGTQYTSDTTTGTNAKILDSKNSNVTVNYCRTATWGKVLMFYIQITTTAALSGTTVVATLKSGLRPRILASAVSPDQADLLCWVRDNGEVVCKGSVSNGASRQIISTFVMT